MSRMAWMIRGLLLGLAGLLVGRNHFLGLSPFALSYFSLLFSYSEDFSFFPVDKKRSFYRGRRFLGSYGTFLLCAVLMGIVMNTSMNFSVGTYIGTGVRYGIALFFSGMLILWCRQKEEKLALFWIGICAFGGQIIGTVIMLLLNHDLSMTTPNQALIYCLEAILSFFLVILFSPGVSFLLKYRSGCRMSQEELLGAGLIFMLFFHGCPAFFIEGVSVRLALMFFVILCAAYFYGAGAGALTGMLLGIVEVIEVLGNAKIQGLSAVLEVAGSGMLVSSRILLFFVIGTVVGITRYYSRFATLVFGGISGAFVLYFTIGLEKGEDVFFAFLAAEVLFLLLPQGWCLKGNGEERSGRKSLKALFSEYPSPDKPEPLLAIAEEKLKENAYAFERLTKYFSNLGKEHGELVFPDAVTMVNDVSTKICAECSVAGECRAAALKGNLEATAGILRAAIFEDDVNGSFFPAEFLHGCIHSEDYLYQINREVMLARMNLRWQNSMAETKRAIAKQMQEMSKICDRLSMQIGSLTKIDYPGERKLKYILKKRQVEIKDFSMLKTWEEPIEVHLYARAKHGECMTTKELSKVIGKQLGMQLRPSKSTKLVLGKQYEKVTLCEETTFRMLLGVARCAKADEEVSGDSFSCMNLENGTALLSISDGMGSGQDAFKESKMIMNLLEELIESGFSEETSIRLIHSVLMEHPEQQSFSTLDVSVVNLYTGTLKMVKIGAVATFLKHGSTVETIQSVSLPMGVVDQQEITALERNLSDGDLIIMMSDGVLEGLQNTLPEQTDVTEHMAQLIAGQGRMNLKDFASLLLKKAGGREYAKDDMTVLVAGVYRK